MNFVRYNDMSPLENHHCAVSFKILSAPECNIFTNLSTEEFKEVERTLSISVYIKLDTCDVSVDSYIPV